MPRKNRINQNIFPYHIFNRSNNKEDFPLPLEHSWQIWTSLLWETQLLFDLKLHAFVLMRNHYHLIASTPESNLSDAMWFLHKNVSETYNQATQKINHRFGSQYKASLIQTPGHLSVVLRYVYQNPFRAKLCKKIVEYPWSSLHGIMGYSSLGLKINPCALWPELWENHPDSIENWIENDFIDTQAIDMKTALSRSIFKIPRPEAEGLQQYLKKEMKSAPMLHCSPGSVDLP